MEIFMENILALLTLLVALNIWVLVGGLILYFLDPDHVYVDGTGDLLIKYIMFPIVVILSLMEGGNAGKPNTKQS